VLPALLHARKVQRRASAVGFDWHAWDGAWGDLAEELRELRDALDAADPQRAEHEPDAHVVHELGDLLFAAVNVARLAGVDPGARAARPRRALSRAGGAGRALALADGLEFAALSLDDQDAWYRLAKRDLRVTDEQPLIARLAGVRDRGARCRPRHLLRGAERSGGDHRPGGRRQLDHPSCWPGTGLVSDELGYDVVKGPGPAVAVYRAGDPETPGVTAFLERVGAAFDVTIRVYQDDMLSHCWSSTTSCQRPFGRPSWPCRAAGGAAHHRDLA
jgi:hypothetical protein